MNVIRAAAGGLCFGVRDALAVANQVARPEAVTILGELVHNREVADNLARRGFVQVAESARGDLPATSAVIITAHGVSDRRRARLLAAGKTLIDTTCPLVRRVQEDAQRFRAEGRFVVVIGRHGHVEVQGITEDLDRFVVVQAVAEVRTWREPTIGIVCQSTTPPETAAAIRRQIAELNASSDIAVADTICRPTRDRQQAVLDLAGCIDVLVVVGGRNSNNTLQLAALAMSRGIRAVHIEAAPELRPEDFHGCRTVGLTAGTSTLDRTVDEVHHALLRIGAQPAPRLEDGVFHPSAMRTPPPLDPQRATRPPAPRSALLINPFYPKEPHASFGKHVLTPSLALTSIAAATPPDWAIRIWDENLLQGPPPADPFPALVGITVHLTFASRAYDLSRWYRDRGALVVLGGLHVTACPEEAAAHADAIAIGEGIQLWPAILADAAKGRLRPVYEGSFRRPYRLTPAPKRSLLPRGAFLTTASMIATQGCRNRCAFCYLSTDGLVMPYSARSPGEVAREFLDTGEPYGVFVDNNLGTRPAHLKALCRALAPIGRIWSAAVTADVADDSTLVRDMALAGCTGVFVGFESLNGANLEEAGKSSPPPEDFARRVEVFHAAGIQVNGSFVFGFDHDDPGVFDRTADWVERVRLEGATFHILTPYPGTPLFAALAAENRILHRRWDLYDTAHAVFLPKLMSPAELEAGYVRCYERVFSARSIWRRRPARLSDLPGYLAMAWIYKRSQRLWPFLIRSGLTRAAWSPLVLLARCRQLRHRRRLAREGEGRGDGTAGHGGGRPDQGLRPRRLRLPVVRS